MKYLKKYESEDLPTYLDYVLMKTDKYDLVIGQIFSDANNYFYVKFRSPDGHTFNDVVLKSDVIKWSKNDEDLKQYIIANKYNL